MATATPVRSAPPAAHGPAAPIGARPIAASAPTAYLPRRPIDEAAWRARQPHGQVHLIPERCKGCRLCVEFCPQQVLTLSTAMNAKGYHFPVVAAGKRDACVACGFCTLVCPEFAIFATENTAPGVNAAAASEVQP